MQTLIILGNGFDLDLGWKTSYKDFFRAKQDSFYRYNNLSYIKQMIEGECWYNLEGCPSLKNVEWINTISLRLVECFSLIPGLD